MTPVDDYMHGVPSWHKSSHGARGEFKKAMVSLSYGQEECRDAWHWFIDGYRRAMVWISNVTMHESKEGL